MIDAEIYEAFVYSWQSYIAQLSPTPPVSYPDLHFVPPADGHWYEIRWFPSQTQNRDLDNDGAQTHIGFFQVGVCWRPGIGIVDTLLLANEVVTTFKKGTRLGPALVEVPPWISPLLELPEKAMLPVTIRYRGTATTC